ncbi:MAG: response regulator [Verrucomicrobiota bacterium]
MGEKFQILLLDDQQLMVDSLARCLNASGYKVFKATNEKDALNCVARENIDLLVLDIELEVGNGFDVYAQANHLNDSVSLPVIFMTGNMSERYQVLLEQVDGAGFLSKPFSPSQMIDLIEQKLTASHQS